MRNLLLLFVALTVVSVPALLAQPTTPFAAPTFRKVDKKDLPAFMRKYNTENLTGRGMHLHETIDNVPTMELRARLEALYGGPTKNVLDLMAEPDFREGKYVQFEYWFEINGSMPMVILDVSGPFASGLVYGGLPKFVDMMPEVKREFSKALMGVTQLAEYTDYYYALDERDKAKKQAIPNGWYVVQYKNGTFSYEKITAPPKGNR